MAQHTANTPTAVVQGLRDAVLAKNWERAVALADTAALATWYRGERAALANLLLPVGPPDLDAADTAAVEDLLRRHADVQIPIPGMGTLGMLTSLSAADYLARFWKDMIEAFGSDVDNPRTPPFKVLGEVPRGTDVVFVRYEGYIGVGGGLPDGLEVRRLGNEWRYVIISDLTVPNFALLISARGGLRNRS